MRFQKTTEYAIRVMVFLASNKDERYSVNSLHKQLDIPYKYLGRLMHTLSTAQLVNVEKGKQGGYRIGKALDDILLYEIVGVVEGLENYDRCVLGFDECSDVNPCLLHKYWLSNRENFKEMLFNTSLADLKEQTNIRI